MGDGIVLQECAACQSRLFPDRLRCPACGSREFTRVRVASGRVEEVATRPGADQAIATVSSNGVTMIARVPATAQAGDVVRLTGDPRDTGAALVPGRTHGSSSEPRRF